MKSGVIKLIHKGMVSNTAKYKWPCQRKDIIEKWRSLYGMEFEKCAIQIRPDVDMLAVYKPKKTESIFGTMPTFKKTA